MLKTVLLSTLLTFLLSFLGFHSSALALTAFPGAEGFGAETVGGRRGKVYEVTNLKDSGTGSFRAAIEASGPRIVVFRTGGIIKLNANLVIKNPYITIAGQTAPGGGITLKGGELLVVTHDVIIRYITVRRGPGGSNHALGIYSNGSSNLYNIMIDHCSLSWGTDSVSETWYGPHAVTWQWTIFSEALDCSTHPKGCHSKGVMLGGYKASESGGFGSYNLSLHHNLIAHVGERSPMVKSSGLADIVNNVQYNNYWTHSHVYMTSKHGTIPVNFVNNYFKKGPDSNTSQALGVVDEGGSACSIYWSGNISYRRTNDSMSQTVDVKSSALPYITTTHHPVSMPVTTTSAFEAYDQVLADSGNNKGLNCDGTFFSRRDAIDQRVANDVKQGTGRIIDDPSDVGGWPSIAEGIGCADSDHDGMPDEWENLHGLNPNDSSDNIQDSNNDGYTNIEEYLNGTKSGAPGISIPEPPKGLRIVY